MSLPSPQKIQIDFQPVGRRVIVPPGEDLLSAAQSAGIGLTSLCGGIGSCDACRVRIISGPVSTPTLEEEAALGAQDLAEGYRLACQTLPLGDVRVDLPAESLTTPQRLQVEGIAFQPEIDPLVRAADLHLQPPTLHDLRADDVRLRDALNKAGIKTGPFCHSFQLQLSQGLRQQSWAGRVVLRSGSPVAWLPIGSALLGFAVDLGTTKIAAYLVDLESGATLASRAAMNPQIGYGEDVVSRIAYANQGQEASQRLRTIVLESLNSLLDELLQITGTNRQTVLEAVIVGNTAMHHLFLGLPVRQLGEAPYVPAVALPLDLTAKQAGLHLASNARVYLPPNVAGYVGGDHIAMALASGLHEEKQRILALDIGTNTEISLLSAGEIYTCSAASGPVFEGAHIQDGMRAAPGAIERVQIQSGQIRLSTIDNLPAVGLCGSGILDAVAEMLQVGMLETSGRLRRDHPLASQEKGRTGLILSRAAGHPGPQTVMVDRQDVHEVQLAKGAIRLGIEVLLKEAGISSDLLDRIIIAGAFGSYIHIPSAVQIGMLPPLPVDRFVQVGNAAGIGARQLLLSSHYRDQAHQLAQQMHYIELTTYPQFMDEFTTWLLFSSSP